MRRDNLHLIAQTIDRLNGWIGRAAAWAVLAMVVVQFAIVVLRYWFGFGSLWMQESLHYLLAILVLFTAGWTLQNDGHVRVDIFYADAARRERKAKVEPRRRAVAADPVHGRGDLVLVALCGPGVGHHGRLA